MTHPAWLGSPSRLRMSFAVAIALTTSASTMACDFRRTDVEAGVVEKGRGETEPISGLALPQGYRDWRLISIATVGPPLNDLRAKLGNDVAIAAFRYGRRPFPDGTIIARLAYAQVLSAENNEGIRGILEHEVGPDATRRRLDASYVAGTPTNVQLMVKDAKRFSSTGGWGFAQFTNGKPDGEAAHRGCFSCHVPAADRDFVFTRYAP